MFDARRHTTALMGLLVLAAAALLPFTCQVWADGAPAGPLAPFEALIGGEWHLEGSIQTFEWGVGRQSVHARSWFTMNGERKLVSDGIWYWHPGEKEIRGVFFATDMPVNFFEYATAFEDGQMISDLVTFTPDGKREVHRETFVFESDDAYVWTLYSTTPDGMKKSMGGTYQRRGTAE